jgi:hypothetical protein
MGRGPVGEDSARPGCTGTPPRKPHLRLLDLIIRDISVSGAREATPEDEK